MIALGDGPAPAEGRGSIYFPLIATPPSSPDDTGLSGAASAFFQLLTTDERQERPSITVCPSLLAAAALRAYGLANGDPWAHVDRYGVTPNEYARNAGCILPADYARKGNNLELLVAGTGDKDVAFTALAESVKHSDPLFGRGWFAHQRHCGIALSENPDSPYGWYWCVMIALCTEESHV